MEQNGELVFSVVIQSTRRGKPTLQYLGNTL